MSIPSSVTERTNTIAQGVESSAPVTIQCPACLRRTLVPIAEAVLVHPAVVLSCTCGAVFEMEAVR